MAVQFGFVDIEHLFDRPVTQVGQAVINEAMDRTLGFYNQRANAMLTGLVQRTNVVQERFRMPGGGSLQGIDEDGNPYPTLHYEGYDVGYPIYGAGDAMGTNRLSRALMTVENVNDKVRDVQVKDKNFLINNILAALFTATERTFLDRTRLGYIGGGEITVKPLANGDATTYITNGSAVQQDNHYRAQTAAIDNTNNPFPSIYEDLAEHLDNGDPEVDVYVPTNLVASIKLLANFLQVADSRVQPGSGTATLVGGIPKGIGDKPIGYVDKCNIIEMRKLPDNYMVAHVRGGTPLALREYPISGWSGLFREEHNVDGNHSETRFLRFCGFGVRNRVSALIYQIGAATYSTPALYTAPLAAA